MSLSIGMIGCIGITADNTVPYVGTGIGGVTACGTGRLGNHGFIVMTRTCGRSPLVYKAGTMVTALIGAGPMFTGTLGTAYSGLGFYTFDLMTVCGAFDHFGIGCVTSVTFCGLMSVSGTVGVLKLAVICEGVTEYRYRFCFGVRNFTCTVFVTLTVALLQSLGGTGCGCYGIPITHSVSRRVKGSCFCFATTVCTRSSFETCLSTGGVSNISPCRGFEVMTENLDLLSLVLITTISATVSALYTGYGTGCRLCFVPIAPIVSECGDSLGKAVAMILVTGSCVVTGVNLGTGILTGRILGYLLCKITVLIVSVEGRIIT